MEFGTSELGGHGVPAIVCVSGGVIQLQKCSVACFNQQQESTTISTLKKFNLWLRSKKTKCPLNSKAANLHRLERRLSRDYVGN